MFVAVLLFPVNHKNWDCTVGAFIAMGHLSLHSGSVFFIYLFWWNSSCWTYTKSMVICFSHQRQQFIVLNSAQQCCMLQSAWPFSGINVPDLKQVKYLKNMLEFVRSQKFYNYCNIRVIGILFSISFMLLKLCCIVSYKKCLLYFATTLFCLACWIFSFFVCVYLSAHVLMYLKCSSYICNDC
jgi:hypothetical protein